MRKHRILITLSERTRNPLAGSDIAREQYYVNNLLQRRWQTNLNVLSKPE